MAKPKKQEPVEKAPELIITPDSIIMKTIDVEVEVTPTVEEKPKAKTLYTSKLFMTNPFTGDVFQPGVPTDAITDSWLQSQIHAGLICPSQVI